MLSITECKKILNQNDVELTEEQLKMVMDLFYCWATIEFKNFKKNNK